MDNPAPYTRFLTAPAPDALDIGEAHARGLRHRAASPVGRFARRFSERHCSHIHDLRHDFASKLLQHTRNLALVKDALAHSYFKSAIRCAHVLDHELAEGMQGMALPE